MNSATDRAVSTFPGCAEVRRHAARSGPQAPTLGVLGLCVLLLPAVGLAQVVANGSFENGLTGWTVGGTGRVAAIQGGNITGTGANVVAPDGSVFAALSTGPDDTGGAVLRIDGNTTNDLNAATLSITVDIPTRPAVLAFDWSFATSEQDQPAEYDDIFDVMLFEGAPPADPTTVGRVFARSSPRNSGGSISNFPDAHTLGTQQITWTIGGVGSAPITNSSLRFRVPPFRRACLALPLPDDVDPPYTRTLRFRVADQTDAGFDSALFIDRVEIRDACDATPLENISQVTETSGNEVTLKDGGFVFRQALNRRLTVDPTGTVTAVASNANLDGNNPNFVEQVYIRVGNGGWQRVTGLPMQLGGEVQGLALSGSATAGTVATRPGRFLAIAARLGETDNTEIYRWNRDSGVLTTITTTSACDNQSPAINRGGDVIAFDSNCATLTGAAGNRHVVAWSGGAVNAVGNVSGTGACVGRNAALNHHVDNAARDGRYVVYESNCSFGSNADGNIEIFRFNRNGSARRQVTVTAAAVANFSPQIDRDNNGANLYFISSGNFTSNNAAGALQLFRFQCNNVNCTGSTGGTNGFFQWTSTPATSLLIGFRRVFAPDANSTAINERFAFERIDLLSGIDELGYRVGASAASEVVLALQPGLLGLAAGDDGGVPVVGFITQGDLIDQNADGNTEIYSVRVE
jgi:hypothetical protein